MPCDLFNDLLLSHIEQLIVLKNSSLLQAFFIAV